MYEFHEIANIFPVIGGREFDELTADIKAKGLQNPVVLFDGKILDGRNRYRACLAAGVEPEFTEYAGADAVGYVVSLNLHRRHLTESQRGMVAAKLEQFTHGGDRKSDQDANLHVDRARAAEMLNVSPRTVAAAAKVKDDGAPELVAAVESGKVSVSAAATLSEAPKERQAEIVAKGEKEILEAAKSIRAERAEVRRAERIQKLVDISKGNAPLDQVSARYPVIYVDPPWRYEHAESESRAIENQYPTMSLDEIKALPVSDIATDDCILFMWATSPKLAESMEVLTAWGFSYRTCAVWDKQKIGMGYYFRQQHELLLVAVKGTPPTPAPANRPASVFSYPRGQHSAKPVEVYEIIEAMYAELPKLEMFCRSPRDGWGVWGNQASAA